MKLHLIHNLNPTPTLNVLFCVSVSLKVPLRLQSQGATLKNTNIGQPLRKKPFTKRSQQSPAKSRVWCDVILEKCCHSFWLVNPNNVQRWIPGGKKTLTKQGQRKWKRIAELGDSEATWTWLNTATLWTACNYQTLLVGRLLVIYITQQHWEHWLLPAWCKKSGLAKWCLDVKWVNVFSKHL